MPGREPWPRGKLRSAVEAARAGGEPPARGYALLLTTGGMNPVHRGHVQLLHQARVRLETEGFAVVGTWLSPSHDLYLLPKAANMGTIGLSGEFRLELARRATAGDPVVEVGAWECAQRGDWPDFPVVCKALQLELGRAPELAGLPGRGEGDEGEKPLTVFYACGTDHAVRCGLYRSGLSHLNDANGAVGVVVVPRSGDTAEAEKPDRLVYKAEPAEGEVASFSSTKVREAIKKRDVEYLERALSPEAARILLHPDSEERRRFNDDYAKLACCEQTR